MISDGLGDHMDLETCQRITQQMKVAYAPFFDVKSDKPGKTGELKKPVTPVALASEVFSRCKQHALSGSILVEGDPVLYLVAISEAPKTMQIVVPVDPAREKYFIAVANGFGEYGRGRQPNGVPNGIHFVCYNSVNELERKLMELQNREETETEKPIPKFGMVVMNPAYENDHWKQLVEILPRICVKNAVIGLISPTNFLKQSEKVHHLIFKNTVTSVHNDVRTKYFPNVGEMIGYVTFILDGKPTTVTKIIGVDEREYEFYTDKIMVPRGLDALMVEFLSKVFYNQPIAVAIPSEYKDKFADASRQPSVYKNHELTVGTANPVQSPGVPRVLLSRRLRRNSKQRTMVTFADETGSKQINDGFVLLQTEPDQSVKNMAWFISESKVMRFISGMFDKSPYLSPELRSSIPACGFYLSNDEEAFKYFDFSTELKERIEKAVS